jgi:bifunctional non-homologous end joining protein LigD
VPDKDQLSRYRKKRSADATPEPAGEATAAMEPFDAAAEPDEPTAESATPTTRGGVFCVQLHDASRLHFDLRLEIEGALASWAVPKGPSLDPAEKRLAVHVEDHPLEYVDFEGVIPDGNYGAGAMILWDRGTWVARNDPVEGLEKGKLLFELRGLKLRGVWTLVKLAKSENEWLLIREKKYVGSDEDLRDGSLPAGSVLSGLTVDQLGAGFDPAPELRLELEESGARLRKLRTAEVDLMLGEARSKPFTRAGWIFELKLDGYRILGGRAGDEVSLRTRNGHSAAATFPEVAQAVAALPFDHFVLDGEVVAHDEDGLPSFQRLQKRAQLRRGPDIEAGALRMPVTFYAFDLLALEGFDLRRLPLVTRKAILRRMLPQAGLIRYVDHFEERGEDVYQHVLGLELEGIVAKKADSSYRGAGPVSGPFTWLPSRAASSDTPAGWAAALATASWPRSLTSWRPSSGPSRPFWTPPGRRAPAARAAGTAGWSPRWSSRSATRSVRRTDSSGSPCSCVYVRTRLRWSARCPPRGGAARTPLRIRSRISAGRPRRRSSCSPISTRSSGRKRDTRRGI